MRVAIIKLGALGDVVRTMSLIPGLKRLDPALELTWITSAAAAPLIRHHPDIQRVCIPGEIEESRHSSYDWVISLDDDRTACRLASSLRSERRSGAFETSDGTLAYTSDLEEWLGMGLLRPDGLGGLPQANLLKRRNVRTYGEILFDGLGLTGPVEPPRIHIPAGAREAAKGLVNEVARAPGRQKVALNTGAGPRWKYKSWGESQTADLARRLHDDLGVTVLVTGGSEESSRNARIVAAANRPHVLAAPPPPELLSFAALLGECDVVVSSDSLAMHLAVAQRVPVVAFFGPTSDSEIDLFGLGEKIVTPLPCRRCYLHDCDVRPHCMQSVGVDSLFDAAASWLGRTTRR